MSARFPKLRKLFPQSLGGQLLIMLLLALAITQGLGLLLLTDERNRAVRAAHAAFPGWRDTPLAQRVERVMAASLVLLGIGAFEANYTFATRGTFFGPHVQAPAKP